MKFLKKIIFLFLFLALASNLFLIMKLNDSIKSGQHEADVNLELRNENVKLQSDNINSERLIEELKTKLKIEDFGKRMFLNNIAGTLSFIDAIIERDFTESEHLFHETFEIINNENRIDIVSHLNESYSTFSYYEDRKINFYITNYIYNSETNLVEITLLLTYENMIENIEMLGAIDYILYYDSNNKIYKIDMSV